MDGTLLRNLFLILFGFGVVLEGFLIWLNFRECLRHQALPVKLAEFMGNSNPVSFLKSRDYTLERMAFEGFSLCFSNVITLALLFTGVLPWLDQTLLDAFGSGLNRGVFFLVIVTMSISLLKLPLSIYSVFQLEGKFGFNTMTWGLYWRDSAKQFVLSIALGLPVLYGLLYFLQNPKPYWWLEVFALVLAFQISMMVIYPIFIAPFFNRFKPLPEGDLKTALLDMARRLQFPTSGIYVMDGSRRSLHANAYFTGFWKWRRIVLFDTLLRQMENSELIAILSHEIGHYKLKHIYRLMGVQFLLMAGFLYLASLFLNWPPFFDAFGFNPLQVSSAVGIFLFLTVFSAGSFLLVPLQNALSRRYEYAADAFAIEACKEKPPMINALVKLSLENASNLTPHPWYSAFNSSHPGLSERIRAIMSTKAT